MVKLNQLAVRSPIFRVLFSFLLSFYVFRCSVLEIPVEAGGPWNPKAWNWNPDVESYRDMNGGGGGDDDNGGDEDDDSGSHGGKNKKKGSGDGDSEGHKDKGEGSDAEMNDKQLDFMGEPGFGYRYGYHAGNENGTPVGQLNSAQEIHSLVSKSMFYLLYLFPVCVD